MHKDFNDHLKDISEHYATEWHEDDVCPDEQYFSSYPYLQDAFKAGAHWAKIFFTEHRVATLKEIEEEAEKGK